jgi:glycosyltransferase involved in cell wall biosynthesis|tara:strand:- start:389 stop:1507 length:1119 start_codon:yes stop_codon:yes gene_type:complete
MKSLSIVIPCLNEEEGISFCLEKIKRVLQKENIEKTEIIIVDNGSTDKSIEIAQEFNVKIIKENKKGYGNALRTGIKHASGEFVAFADADDSYDFLELNKFIQKANEGYDVIQGCRFKKCGGNIHDGAMPFSHRYFGNPFLSFMTKLFFGIKFNDVYCGFRMFKKSIYEKNFYFSNGMEFAVENIIKLFFSTKKYVEIPITLHRDKRKNTIGHLKTLSDGFKTLKFILLQGSQIPSLILSAIFMFFSFQYYHKVDFADASYLDSNFLITVAFFFASIQFIFFSLYANLASIYLGFKKNKFLLKIYKFLNFNQALLLSTLLLIFSIFLLINIKLEILNLGNYSLIIGLTILGVSIQLIMNVLIVSILEFFKKN